MTSSLAPSPHRGVPRDARAPVTVGVIAALGTAALTLGNPNTTSIPLCPLQALTGIDCPLCGSLRAVHALGHLDLAGALSHNLLFTVSAPALVAAWTLWLLRSLGRPVLARWRLPAAANPVLLAVAIVFAVARNLPAFAWLGSGA